MRVEMPAGNGCSNCAASHLLLRVHQYLSLIHISEPTRPERISYAVFCLHKLLYFCD